MSKVHDLILIRHEEAEGNVAMVKSKFRGDESLFTPEFRKKPSDTWHLTDRGRERCKAIRGWLEKRVPIGDKFRLITSPSVRAVGNCKSNTSSISMGGKQTGARKIMGRHRVYSMERMA